MELYRIYDKTLEKYPINRNRNNSWYEKIGHVSRALTSWQHKFPDHDFEVHTYLATPVVSKIWCASCQSFRRIEAGRCTVCGERDLRD